MNSDTGTAQAVTVLVTRVVAPGKEDEFARWADDVDRAAARFAGHLGAVRLHDGQGLHHLVYRFDTPEHLDAWERSDVRHDLLQRGNRISDPRRSRSADLS